MIESEGTRAVASEQVTLENYVSTETLICHMVRQLAHRYHGHFPTLLHSRNTVTTLIITIRHATVFICFVNFQKFTSQTTPFVNIKTKCHSALFQQKSRDPEFTLTPGKGPFIVENAWITYQNNIDHLVESLVVKTYLLSNQKYNNKSVVLRNPFPVFGINV